MTQNFLDCLKTLFGCAWSMLTSFHLPGTNITPAALMLFGAVAYISLKFMISLFGVGGVQDANVFNSYRRIPRSEANNEQIKWDLNYKDGIYK